MDKVFIVAHKSDGQTNTVKRGVKFAKKLNKQAEVFGYSYEPLPNFDDYVPAVTPLNQNAILEKDKKRIEEILERMGAEDVPVHSLWNKYLYEHVAKISVEQQFSMIIKGVHNSDRLTPTDWHLMRHTRVPVLFLNDNEEFKSDNILLALDLSSKSSLKQALNQKIIHVGKNLAKACGLTLHIAHVVRMPTLVNDLDLINNQMRIDKAKHRLLPQLQEIGIAESEFHVAAGDPEICLYQLSCALQAKYLVLGARQRKGFFGYVIGNTAEAILSKIQSNIVVVPVEDAET